MSDTAQAYEHATRIHERAAEHEATRIRKRATRQAVELLVIGEPDLAHMVMRAGFVAQVHVLGLDPGGWT